MLPPGDILIHTGSFSKEGGTDADYTKFNNFLKSAKNYYKNIIVVVSSGDTTLLHDKVDEIRKRLSCATHVLCNEAVEVLGITFYGAPQHTKKKSSSAKIVSSIFGQSQKTMQAAAVAMRYQETPHPQRLLLTTKMYLR